MAYRDAPPLYQRRTMVSPLRPDVGHSYLFTTLHDAASKLFKTYLSP